MDFREVKTKNHILAIENLARTILPKFYSSLIPDEHTLYFLDKFQSSKALVEQINSHFDYYLLEVNGQRIGYMGLEWYEKSLVLSKLYLLEEYRGLGFGKESLDFVKKLAQIRNIQKILLVVNRKALRSINFYSENGFIKVQEVLNKYDNGFEIEDLLMEFPISDN